MEGPELQALVDEVKARRLSRRGFINRMVAVGLTAPMATQLLALGGVAYAQTAPTYKPTKAGGGGTLKLLWWQGPTLLNPHFAVGTKDQGRLPPVLRAAGGVGFEGRNCARCWRRSCRAKENGGLSEDGKTVTWKLKQGVKWHDGKPFTADDVVFNWAYARDPATAAVTAGSYNTVTVEKVDDYTVKRRCSPRRLTFWADAFVGVERDDHPEAPVRGVCGRASRGRRRPTWQAGRHRDRTCSRISGPATS